MTLSTDWNVKNFLKSINLPGIRQTLGEVGRIVEAELADGRATATIELGFPAESEISAWRDHIAKSVTAETGATDVDVELSSSVVAHGVQRNLKPLPEVKNVIAVASGKGGVGKSTVAVNLALALAADGASVGMLDADIYGPSQPHMVGLVGERPTSEDGKTMQPLNALGLQVMSIGFLVDPDAADGLARTDGDVGVEPDAATDRMACPRLPDSRYAARHRRYSTYAVATGACLRGSHCHDAAGHCRD